MSLFRRRKRKPTWAKPIATSTREEARRALLPRVAHWSAQMAIEPNKVFIRNSKTRWGSASSLGNVGFNWRISKLPEPVMDYVIIHELAHLVEMNHSQAFWDIVAAYSPEHKRHRAWLRDYSRGKLALE